MSAERKSQEFQKSQGVAVGDRIRTPDGLEGTLQALGPDAIVLQEPGGQTRWIYPMADFTLDEAGRRLVPKPKAKEG